MKSLEVKELEKAYGEVPDGFHQAVKGALEKLEDKKMIRYTKRRTALRIAAACAAVVSIGTFTAAAAAIIFRIKQCRLRLLIQKSDFHLNHLT